MNIEENKSEVARLMQQIDLECQAARWALTGLAAGTAQHEFIRARMNAVAEWQDQLTPIVGAEEATRLMYDQYNVVMDAPDVPPAPVELLQTPAVPRTSRPRRKGGQ